MSIINSVAWKILKDNRSLAINTCIILKFLGMNRRSSKISLKTGHMPEVTPVYLQNFKGTGNRSFKMYTQKGRDLVAADIWYLGWDKFEQPLPQVMACFSRLCSGTFLDIGANTGFYALICQALNQELRIHAFEPYPPVLKLLRDNFELNSLSGKVEVFDYAVSEKSGSAKFYVPLQDHGLVESSCSLDSQFKDEHSEVIDVTVKTLDSHAEEFNLKDISMLKVDVEGAEHEVLLGANKVIEENRPFIFIEVLSRAKIDIIEEVRKKHDYLSFLLLPPNKIVAEEAVEFNDDSWNHLLVPKEKAGFVQQALTEMAGLPN